MLPDPPLECVVSEDPDPDLPGSVMEMYPLEKETDPLEKETDRMENLKDPKFFNRS